MSELADCCGVLQEVTGQVLLDFSGKFFCLSGSLKVSMVFEDKKKVWHKILGFHMKLYAVN